MLEVVKKRRSGGAGNQNPEAPASGEAAGSGGQAGAGSPGTGVWVNDRGETCIGTDCYTLALDTERREIRVNIRQSGACELDPFVAKLRETLGKGARTVYEVETEWQPD